MFGPNLKPPERYPFRSFNLMAGIVAAMMGTQFVMQGAYAFGGLGLVISLVNIYVYYRCSP